MKKAILFFLFLAITFSDAYSQIKTGRVLDENGKPLIAATVIQLMPQDSTMLDATLTDSLGFYNILKNKTSVLKISFLGYEDMFLNYICDNGHTQQKIKDIKLTPKSFDLGEVIVKGNSPKLSRKAEHFSFSLANTELVKGKNAWDILNFTPFLKIDDMHGVEMVGKGLVTVYINGRKTRFTGSFLKSYLESFSAENIVNIEIMTNKSSAYRAEETSGAINIIMKKNELEGLKGNIAFRDKQSDYKNFWDGSTFLNYKKGKIDLATNIFVNKYDNHQESTVNYNYREENTAIKAHDITKRDDFSYGLLFNMDYIPIDNHTLGIILKATMNDNKQSGLNFNYYQPINQIRLDSISKSDRNNSLDANQINANVNYYIKLNDKKDFISVDFDFLRYNSHNQRTTSAQLLESEAVPTHVLGNWNQKQKQEIINAAGKIDYRLNFNEQSKLNLGAEVYTTRSDADEHLSYFTLGDSENKENNRFLYKETVSAVYSSFTKEWDKFSTMIGLRFEHTYGKGEVEKDRTKDFVRKNWNLFPSAAINYIPNSNNSVSLSFSSGIRRPEFTLLNPFRIYTSEISYRENNPFLKNMQTYFMDLTYTFKSKYIIRVSHFISTHTWSLFRIPIENTNVTREFFSNYGNTNITNINLIWNESLFNEFWYVNYNVGGYYSHSNGDVESTRIDISGYTPSLYLSNSFRLSQKQGIRMMVSYSFMGKEKMANVTRTPTHNLNMSIQKRFGNLNVSLGINDILNLKVTESYNTNNYDYKSVVRFNRRNIWLSATYDFGNQKVKGARNRRTNTEINRRVN